MKERKKKGGGIPDRDTYAEWKREREGKRLTEGETEREREREREEKIKGKFIFTEEC